MRPILFLPILVLLLSSWLFPSATPALAAAVLLFSLGIAIFVVLKKHRTAYLQGQIAHWTFVRNIFLDLFGILLAVVLAGLLARYVAGIVTKPIGSATARVAAGIVLGLLAGIVVGALVNNLWGRFVKTSSRS